MSDAVREEASQRDREYGHAVRGDSYDVWVMTWGEIIDNAMRRLDFLRDQLDHEVTQLEHAQSHLDRVVAVGARDVHVRTRAFERLDQLEHSSLQVERRERLRA